MGGVYALLMHLTAPCSLEIGNRQYNLDPGVYVYAGSALGPGGVAGRLKRHFKTFTTHTTKRHWHIDHLLPISASLAAVFSNSQTNMECALVLSLKQLGLCVVKGFGNTDCKSGCMGHLLSLGNVEFEEAIETVIKALQRLGLNGGIEVIRKGDRDR
ncbi:MAG: GIY-YIG nuclease family protein [Candidatus Methanomethylicaceae archaeon]